MRRKRKHIDDAFLPFDTKEIQHASPGNIKILDIIIAVEKRNGPVGCAGGVGHEYWLVFSRKFLLNCSFPANGRFHR